MPKELVNNRINYSDRDGRILQHDIWLNQSLTTLSSPTFANLQISGDTVLDGNLFVGGNSTILSNTVIEFQDNIILLNDTENGAGITLNQGGIELDMNSCYASCLLEDDFKIPIKNAHDIILKKLPKKDSKLKYGFYYYV